MKDYIRTYKYYLVVMLVLVFCGVCAISQNAEAITGEQELTKSEVRFVSETANVSGPMVPAEHYIKAQESEVAELDDFEDVEIVAEEITEETQKEVIENRGSKFTAEAEPVEVQTVVKIVPSPAVADYSSAEEYATACGLDYVQNRTDTIYDVFSEEDLQYIYRMVETETYQCPYKAKINVAEAAFCRYYSCEEGTATLKGIITAENQFAYHRTNISQDTVWAVEYAYQHATEVNNCRYFKQGGGDTWYGCQLILVDEVGHHFYGEPCEYAPVVTEEEVVPEEAIEEVVDSVAEDV